MASGGLIREIFNLTTGVWTLACLFGVYLVWRWPEIKRSYTEAAHSKNAAKESFLDRLERRLVHLEQREEECQHKLADAIRRIAQLEGYQQGQGDARQEAANILAIERAEYRKEKKP